MKKKSFSVVMSIALLLSGCFGSSDDKAPSEKKIEGFHVYSTEEFSIQVPDEWEVLTPVNFQSDTPKNTLTAFRSNIRSPKFTANAALVKNELSEEILGLDYAKVLRQKTADSLADYHEILTEQTKLVVGGNETDTILFVADGREATDQNLKRFMQISGIKGKTAYIAIGSFLTEEGEGTAKKVETMLRNFEVK